MHYREFQGLKLSHLGFGAMRLPMKDGEIDEPQVMEMVRYAAEHGVNYFDTAYPYHNGRSETVLCKALRQLPRESYYLADKYPGHQISERYDPADIFEDQLKKCGVEYFDFYLLHNVYENCYDVYTDPKWGIVDYFVEQKRLGRIRHLGFSSHGQLEMLTDFLDRYQDVMEFCQLQINYLDWTLQKAREKYELLTARGIPVWVMEPLRGGKLAALDAKAAEPLRALRPEESDVAWAFRFLQGLPNVGVILSGMSSMEQMVDNVRIFEEEKPLNEAETEAIMAVAEGMKSSVPCTACRYCCDGCPRELDIPLLLRLYNDMKYSLSPNVGMTIDSLAEYGPAACISCGRCTRVCPQRINIPLALAELTVMHAKLPRWADVSKERGRIAQEERASRMGE